MLARELSNILTAMDPDSHALVALYTTDGRRELFDIIDVTASNGDTLSSLGFPADAVQLLPWHRAETTLRNEN